VRHLESLATSKNFDEAKSILYTVKLLGMVAPDANTARALEAAEKKITSGNQHPSNLARQQKQWAEMKDAVGTVVNARIARLLAEYEAAGCKPGRIALKAAIKNAGSMLGPDLGRGLLVKVGKAARNVEPTRVLSLLARPVAIRAMLDGEDLGPFKTEPLEIRVVDGDLIQLKVPEVGAQDAKKRAIHAALTATRLDGKDLDARHWYLSKSDDLATLEPGLKRTELIRVPANDAKLKTFSNAKALAERGAFIAASGESAVALPIRDEEIDWEQDFALKKLPILWLGCLAENCILVLKIPE
jgi:hypothetical protein